MQGSYAYVATQGAQGLQIISIKDVTNPTIVGNFPTSNTVTDIFVQGRYAYIAAIQNLYIVDIQNPTSPTLAGSLSGLNSATSIFVQGRYAYITRNANVVTAIDVSTPSSPTVVGSMPTNAAPNDVFVQGRYAYVVSNATSPGTLQVFDLGGSYIQQLEAGGMEVGTLQTRENMTVNNDLDVRGGATFGRGFDAIGNSSIASLNSCGNPPTSAVGSIATQTEPNALYVQGRYAYVINGVSNSLQIFDVSNPATIPAALATIGTATTPSAVYVQGRYAYVASASTSTNTLQIFDISNPKSPITIGALNILTSGTVYVQGRYAYVITLTERYKSLIYQPLQHPSL